MDKSLYLDKPISQCIIQNTYQVISNLTFCKSILSLFYNLDTYHSKFKSGKLKLVRCNVWYGMY